jgi:lactate dehydrogenase-like 2-hydroxyacid dehydrogenase
MYSFNQLTHYQSNTRNLISTNEFNKMKKGIVIVNTARGGVMDEDALVNAIDSGLVRSVGLDVYQQEPNIHPGLVSNPHVCLLPHMGTFTVEVSFFPTSQRSSKQVERPSHHPAR